MDYILAILSTCCVLLFMALLLIVFREIIALDDLLLLSLDELRGALVLTSVLFERISIVRVQQRVLLRLGDI